MATISASSIAITVLYMHHTLWVLAAISAVGVVVSLLRPGTAKDPAHRASAADAIEEAILEEIQAVP